MNTLHAHAAAARLEAALKVFQTTMAGVDEQWNDSARLEFQQLYLDAVEPNVKEMLAVISRLGTVFASAESQCGNRYGTSDE